jgi:hypothetical protein
MSADDPLIEELREATRALLFMSESDYPLEVFRWDDVVEVTPEYLRGLAGRDASAPVETMSAGEFFRSATSEPEWKSEAELATARKFKALVQLLEEGLEELKVYRVGKINMPVYVVGRTPAGSWMGVTTRVVET